jgi:hypothetical protein
MDVGKTDLETQKQTKKMTKRKSTGIIEKETELTTHAKEQELDLSLSKQIIERKGSMRPRRGCARRGAASL